MRLCYVNRFNFILCAHAGLLCTYKIYWYNVKYNMKKQLNKLPVYIMNGADVVRTAVSDAMRLRGRRGAYGDR